MESSRTFLKNREYRFYRQIEICENIEKSTFYSTEL